MKFYAVRAGHKAGVYHSWADCKEQITGFKGAVCELPLVKGNYLGTTQI
jgi:ribonuclease HI